MSSAWFRSVFATLSLEKNSPSCQRKLLRAS